MCHMGEDEGGVTEHLVVILQKQKDTADFMGQSLVFPQVLEVVDLRYSLAWQDECSLISALLRVGLVLPFC